MDPVERRLLGMAVETEWGLYEAVRELRSEYPPDSEAKLIARARVALLQLISRGLVEVFLDSSRPPATADEDKTVREDLARRLGGRVTGPVAVPVTSELSAAQIERVVTDDDSWRPPEGRGGRPWWETPCPFFMATERGETAYRDEVKKGEGVQ